MSRQTELKMVELEDQIIGMTLLAIIGHNHLTLQSAHAHHCGVAGSPLQISSSCHTLYRQSQHSQVKHMA